MGDPADAFGLFVSAVEGHPVSRFGAPGGSVLIGADRDPDNPRKIIYRPDAVIAIPHHEALRYGREYNRLITDGALVARTADDWRGQQIAAQTAAPVKAEPKAQKGEG
jgi:hypothetical protein